MPGFLPLKLLIGWRYAYWLLDRSREPAFVSFAVRTKSTAQGDRNQFAPIVTGCFPMLASAETANPPSIKPSPAFSLAAQMSLTSSLKIFVRVEIVASISDK
jgi:hypothetical protein